jgi:hypothetical protein
MDFKKFFVKVRNKDLFNDSYHHEKIFINLSDDDLLELV